MLTSAKNVYLLERKFVIFCAAFNAKWEGAAKVASEGGIVNLVDE